LRLFSEGCLKVFVVQAVMQLSPVLTRFGHLDKGAHLTMSKLFTKLQEEFNALLPPTLFFFVALHLVALLRILMLKGTGIPLNTSWQVTVAALILGKAVLVADLLPFINRYPDKPLIYNITWKTTIYVLVAMLVHYLEHLVDFWREAGSLVAGATRSCLRRSCGRIAGPSKFSWSC
jgi:hypothetical protein